MNRILFRCCMLFIAVSGIAFYLTQRDHHGRKVSASAAAKPTNVAAANLPDTPVVEQHTTPLTEKKCACCREKLARARKIAKERMQAREAWGRKLIADYGYEEGMKRIAAKSPWLVDHLKQSLIENGTQLEDEQIDSRQHKEQ